MHHPKQLEVVQTRTHSEVQYGLDNYVVEGLDIGVQVTVHAIWYWIGQPSFNVAVVVRPVSRRQQCCHILTDHRRLAWNLEQLTEVFAVPSDFPDRLIVVTGLYEAGIGIVQQ